MKMLYIVETSVELERDGVGIDVAMRGVVCRTAVTQLQLFGKKKKRNLS